MAAMRIDDAVPRRRGTKRAGSHSGSLSTLPFFDTTVIFPHHCGFNEAGELGFVPMATQHARDGDAASPPVDGDPTRLDGPVGWRVAAATFLATFTVFGVSYSFGAFFGPMADEFGTDRGTTAFFFAITTFLYFALGVGTGHLADRHGPRPVLITGTVFLVAGLLATSRVPSIWLGYLTYGLGVGVGVACAYVPMVAAVGGWFERQRTTALGFAVAGIGVGTLTVAPLAEWLIGRYGWRTSYVILGIGAAVLLTIAAVGATKPPQGQAAVDSPESLRRVLRERREFWVLYGAMTLVSVSLFVPFVFLPDYLDTEGISGPAGWLIGLIGISSVVGRLGLGAMAARYSSMRLYVGSFLVLGLSFLIWILAGQSYAALLVFAVVLGVAYGGFIALSPAVTAEVFGPVGLGAVLGALYTAAGIGGLIGPPAMGWLIDGRGYSTALLVAMAFALAATATLTRLDTGRGPDGGALRDSQPTDRVGVRHGPGDERSRRGVGEGEGRHRSSRLHTADRLRGHVRGVGRHLPQGEEHEPLPPV